MRYSRFDIAVMASFICLVLLALVMVSRHIGQEQRRGMIGSVEFGLKRTYAQSTTFINRTEHAGAFSLEPAQLRKLQFYRGDGDNMMFPSFVASSNVFLPLDTVRIPSIEILCVVQMPDGSLHGIDGNGHCLEVSAQQFSRWRHRVLADANQ